MSGATPVEPSGPDEVGLTLDDWLSEALELEPEDERDPGTGISPPFVPEIAH
jgi:hypothetical protein